MSKQQPQEKKRTDKKHSDVRTAEVAKAGKRSHYHAPPEEKVDVSQATVHFVINALMNGETWSDVIRRANPNHATAKEIEKAIEFFSTTPKLKDTVAQINIKRWRVV
ncbi:MAG: hypothetical protein ACWGQW_02865 [bacterium]